MENEYQRITRGRWGILIFSSREISCWAREEKFRISEKFQNLQTTKNYFVYYVKTSPTRRRLYSRCHSFVALKRAGDVSATDWRLQIRKIIVIFHMWWKSLWRTPVYTINYDKSARSAIMCLIGSTYESINVASNKTKAQQRRPSLLSFRPC